MADTKISGLPASTTPLAGTEVLPIVQSGVTKQVSVANLTAGRAISATELTISTGNLVIGTAGKGIDFSADPATAGMTSELLDDYEEGTYTPTIVPGTSGTITLLTAISTLSYTKIGRLVTVTGLLQVDSSSSPVGSFVTLSLPFTIDGTGYIGRTVGGVVTRIGGANSGLLNIGAEGSPNMFIYIDASTVVSTRQFSISISFITA